MAHNTVMPQHAAATTKMPAASGKAAKPDVSGRSLTKPDEVIPLDDKEFKDF